MLYLVDIFPVQGLRIFYGPSGGAELFDCTMH